MAPPSSQPQPPLFFRSAESDDEEVDDRRVEMPSRRASASAAAKGVRALHGQRSAKAKAPPPSSKRQRVTTRTTPPPFFHDNDSDESETAEEGDDWSMDAVDVDEEGGDESSTPDVVLTRHIKHTSKRAPELVDVKPKIEKTSEPTAQAKQRGAALSGKVRSCDSSRGKKAGASSSRTANNRLPEQAFLVLRKAPCAKKPSKATSSKGKAYKPNLAAPSSDDVMVSDGGLTPSEGTLASDDEHGGMGRWDEEDQKTWIQSSYMLSDRDAGSDDSEYEAEDIIRHRVHKRRGHIEYRTKWKNFRDRSNSWEPGRNFTTRHPINKYWKEASARGERKPFNMTKAYDAKVDSARDPFDTDVECLCDDAAVRRAARKRKRYDIRIDRYILRQRRLDKLRNVAAEKAASPPTKLSQVSMKRPRMSDSEDSNVSGMEDEPSRVASPYNGNVSAFVSTPIRVDKKKTMPVATAKDLAALGRAFLPEHDDKLKRDKREKRKAQCIQPQEDVQPPPQDDDRPDGSREVLVESFSVPKVPQEVPSPPHRPDGPDRTSTGKFAGAHKTEPKVKFKSVVDHSGKAPPTPAKKLRQNFTGQRPLGGEKLPQSALRAPSDRQSANPASSSSRRVVSFLDDQVQAPRSDATGSRQTSVAAARGNTSIEKVRAKTANAAQSAVDKSETPTPKAPSAEQAGDDACGWDDDPLPFSEVVLDTTVRKAIAEINRSTPQDADDSFARLQHREALPDACPPPPPRCITVHSHPTSTEQNRTPQSEPTSNTANGDEGWGSDPAHDPLSAPEATASTIHDGGKFGVTPIHSISSEPHRTEVQHDFRSPYGAAREEARFGERGQKQNSSNPNLIPLPPRDNQSRRHHSATRDGREGNEHSANRWTDRHTSLPSMPPPSHHHSHRTAVPGGAADFNASSASDRNAHDRRYGAEFRHAVENDGAADCIYGADNDAQVPGSNVEGCDDEGWGSPELASADARRSNVVQRESHEDASAPAPPTDCSPLLFTNALQPRRSDVQAMNQEEPSATGSAKDRWTAPSDRGRTNAPEWDGAARPSQNGHGDKRLRPLPTPLYMCSQAFAEQKTLPTGDSGVDLVLLASPMGISNIAPDTPIYATPPLSRGKPSSSRGPRGSVSRERLLDSNPIPRSSRPQKSPPPVPALPISSWIFPSKVQDAICNQYHIVVCDPTRTSEHKELYRYVVSKNGGWKPSITDKMRKAENRSVIWMPRLSWPLDTMLREAVTRPNFQFMLYEDGRVTEVWKYDSPRVTMYSMGALVKKILLRCSLPDGDEGGQKAWRHTGSDRESVIVHPWQLSMIDYLILDDRRVVEFLRTVLRVDKTQSVDQEAWLISDDAEQVLQELEVRNISAMEPGEQEPWLLPGNERTSLVDMTDTVDRQVRDCLGEMQATLDCCRQFTLVMSACSLHADEIRTCYAYLDDDDAQTWV